VQDAAVRSIVLVALSIAACKTSTASSVTTTAPAASAAPSSSAGDPIAQARKASPVKADEEVVLFPALGVLDETTQSWRVEVHGWIYEPEKDSLRRRAAIAVMRKALGLDESQDEAKHFDERAQLFLADNERGKALWIEAAGEAHRLPASEEDGHFFGTLSIAASRAKAGALPLRVLMPEGDSRGITTTAFLLAPEGIFLVSDVDDTVKVSNVLDKKELLRNTFLRPYRTVPGMSDLYRRLLTPADHLHFVSSSPWQLFGLLDGMVASDKFPAASFHLKRVRPRNLPVDELLADPLTTKPPAIEPLFAKYPKRRFILIGDSGEKDPEVYGLIYRKFGARIERIAIRDVTNEPASAPRYKKAFDGVPADRWEIFTDPAQCCAGHPHPGLKSAIGK
jgi:phosphatidate phosphatase APP1